MTSLFKENRGEIRTDVDMLLMVEKGIRGGICHVMDMRKQMTHI